MPGPVYAILLMV